VRETWQWQGEKNGKQVTLTATNRAVAMATRVVGKDEGDCKGSKSNGDGNKQGGCKEVDNSK
jgi:hypothetical protein